MKYYHCVTFFNELDLLEILLHTIAPLNPIVVLVEATTTHTGDPKKLYFEENKERYKDFNIRHFIVDLPNTGEAWDAEHFQRECVGLGLYDCEDDDVIFIGDLDEIPNPEIVKLFNLKMKIAGLKMTKFSYYLNCVECYQCWEMAKLTSWGVLKNTTPNKIRNGGHDYIMEQAGWHISFLGGVEKMIEKFYAYAHTETVTSDLVDPEILQRKYETGQSLWGNDFWRFVKIDSSFPKYIFDNQEKYSHLIKKI